MDDLNVALLLNTTAFSDLHFRMHNVCIVPFTTICGGVINLTFLLTEYQPSDKTFTSIHFFVIRFNVVEWFNN